MVQCRCKGWRRPWPRHLPWRWSRSGLASPNISIHNQKFQKAANLNLSSRFSTPTKSTRYHALLLPSTIKPANSVVFYQLPTNDVKCCKGFLVTHTVPFFAFIMRLKPTIYVSFVQWNCGSSFETLLCKKFCL